MLQQALAEAGTRLAVSFSVLVEAIHLKLPTALKNRFDKDYKAALLEPPTPEAAQSLLDTVASYRVGGVTYRGQKTHEKKALTYLQRVPESAFSEDQLQRIGYSLLFLESRKASQRVARAGQDRFPKNPHFPFLQAEAYISMGPDRCPTWIVVPLLGQAHELASKLPPDEERDQLIEKIDGLQKFLGAHGALLQMQNGGFFEDMFGFDDDDYDDDDGF